MTNTGNALENKKRIQKEGLHAWLENFNIGTFCWATGVGKSKGALDCIEHMRHEFLMHDIGTLPVLLVTPTEEMRDVDWPEEFKKWGISKDNIKIICYASLAKENLDNYDLIVYDECHRLTLPNLLKLKTVKKAVLGLTATYPKIKHEDDKERIELLQELIPAIHTVTTDEAVDLQLISDFEITVVKFNLDDKIRNISIASSHELRTEQEHYKKLSSQLQRAMILGSKGIKLKLMAMSKRAQFIYNLPSKERLAKKILDSIHTNEKRTIVFGGSIEQIEKLCGKHVYHSNTTDTFLRTFQTGNTNLLGAVRVLNRPLFSINLFN